MPWASPLHLALRIAGWCAVALPRAADAVGVPDTGGAFACTLGAECNLVVSGTNLPMDGARYEVLIVVDEGRADPCAAGFTAASFAGLTNPRNVEDDANDDTFKLRTADRGETAISYQLCWAAADTTLDSRGGAALTEYTYHVGSFTMNGPDLQDITCTMGKACTLSLDGAGLVSTNAVYVIEGDNEFFCGTRANDYTLGLGTTFTNPLRVADSSPYGTYSFGLPAARKSNGDAVTTGLVYRMCWSSSPTTLATVNDYSVDFGSFTLHGPDLISAGIVCEFTKSCQVTLTGSGLDSLTFYVLIIGVGESCGSASPTRADIGGGTWTNPGDGTVDATGLTDWGTATAGTASDQYTACWGSSPSSDADYNVEIGSFTMAGPLTADYSCVKGDNCRIDLAGAGLDQDNRVMIIQPGETCGDSNPNMADWSPMAVVDRQPEADYMEYQLGYPNDGTAQTGYLLCWGEHPASYGTAAEQIASYGFTVGTFALLGPNKQPMACTMGLDCTLQLAGVSLAAANEIIIYSFSETKECGENAAVLATTLRGMLYSQQVANTPPYDTYAMGTPLGRTPRGTADPNTYKICWSSDPAGADSGNFRVNVGTFTLNGPVLVSQECTLSMMCSVFLTGVGLATTSGVIVIHDTAAGQDSCGAVDQALANFEGIAVPRQAEASDFGTSQTFHLGIGGADLSTDGSGTGYRICWAHQPSSLTDYTVSLGTFTMHGPSVAPLEECTMGLSCTIELLIPTGIVVENTNMIIVAANDDECGQAVLNLPAFEGMTNPKLVQNGGGFNDYDLGVFTHGVPGDYAVCWSHRPDSVSDHASFTVRVATLRVNGPVPQPTSCIFSEPCQIALDGLKLQALSKVTIIHDSATCGSFTAGDVVGHWDGVINPASSAYLTPNAGGGTVFSPTGGDTYELGLAVNGAPDSAYWLCWAFEPNDLVDYKVRVGRFTMYGPTQGMSISCTLGEACRLQITGLGLQPTNRVSVVVAPTDGGPACDTVRVPATLEGFTPTVLVTDDATDNTYAMGMVTLGGSYAACRVAAPAGSCIGDHYKLCWAHGVYRPTPSAYNLVVEFGSFSVNGPFSTYSVDCVLGAVCAFKIYGAGLAATNRALIMEDHGRCGDANPPLARISGLLNPHRAAEVVVEPDGLTSITFRLGRSHGGKTGAYRLCWGNNPVLMSQYNIEVGPFNFRAPTAGCSYGDGLSMTCSAAAA